ncbi:MAG: hypothetical protein PHI18_08340, partial [bacterium]|nr:hypothetical protein [bacterium]
KKGFAMVGSGWSRLMMGLCLTVGIAGAGWAQDWPDALREAQAKCERQRGAIHDMTIVEDMAMTSDEGEMKAEHTLYRQGERSRVEMTMHAPQAGIGDLRTIVIDNGTDVWMFNSLTGKRKMSPEEASQRGEFRECWDFTPGNSTVVGSESVNGSECYLVDMTLDSVQHRLWLEQSTGRVIQGEAHDGDASVRWALSDFRAVFGDYEYPHKIELFDGGQTISTMIVKSIAVNTGLSDDLFDPDKVEMATPSMDELLQQMLQEAEEDSQ